MSYEIFVDKINLLSVMSKERSFSEIIRGKLVFEWPTNLFFEMGL